MRKRERPRADAAIDAAHDTHQRVTAAAIQRHDGEVALLVAAAIDYVGRARRVSTMLTQAIKRNDVKRAAVLSHHLAALSRMAQMRLTVAAERRHAVLTFAESVLRPSIERTRKRP